jgi:cytochrome c
VYGTQKNEETGISMKTGTIISAAALLAGAGYLFWAVGEQAPQPAGTTMGDALAEVTVPELFSENAQIGERAYTVNCAACHGANAAGQDGIAPPLVHVIYEPNHHGDESFQRAAAMGVQSHHWRFGNMPPVEGITRGDVTLIIAYIRELQSANGIN